MKRDGYVLEGKSFFKMMGLTSFPNWIETLNIVFIARTTSKKVESLTRSMKFLSPGVALYLYKFTIRSCKKTYCNVWAGTSSCYLEFLNKIQKRKFRTAVPSLAAYFKPLA